MAYTKQEEIELNKQLKKWQKRQLTAVGRGDIDVAFNSMNDIDSAVWEQVAKAESYKDVNVIAWGMAEKIISKYCKMVWKVKKT